MSDEVFVISDDSDDDVPRSSPLPPSSQPESIVISDTDEDENDITFASPNALVRSAVAQANSTALVRKPYIPTNDTTLRPRPSLLETLDQRFASSQSSLFDDVPSSSVASSPKRKKQSVDFSSEGDELGSSPPRKRRKNVDCPVTASMKEAAKTQKQAEREAKKREKELEAERKKQIKAAEKARAKCQGETEKTAKKLHAEVNKLVTSKSDTVKDFTLHVSDSMKGEVSKTLMTAIKDRLGEHDCKVVYGPSPLTAASPDIHVMRWERTIRAKFNDVDRQWEPLATPYKRFEATHLLYIHASSLLSPVTSATATHNVDLISRTITSLRRALKLSDAHQIFIMIDDLEAYYRRRGKGSRAANAQARENLAGKSEGVTGLVEKSLVERSLASMQVAQRCFIVHVEGIQDAAEWLYNMTADLGIKPHKLIERSHLPFCPKLDRLKTGSDQSDTYLKMLMQLQLVTESGARGVTGIYPTLRDLFDAFEREATVEAREGLLKDVVVRHNVDGKHSGKILNKALSKRIAMAFTTEDSLATLA